DLLYDGDRPLTPQIVQIMFASTYVLEDMTSGQASAEAIEKLYNDYKKLLDATGEIPPGVLAAVPITEAEPAANSNVVSMEHRLPSDEEAASKAQQRAALSSTRTGQIVRVPLERLDEL